MWKDGKKVGTSFKWTPEGRIREAKDESIGLTLSTDRTTWKGNTFGFSVSGNHLCGFDGIDMEVCDHDGSDRVSGLRECILLYCCGCRIMICNKALAGGYDMTLNSYYYKGDAMWPALRQFFKNLTLGKRGAAMALRSIKQYAELMNFELSEEYHSLLASIEQCIPVVDPLPTLTIPVFPGSTDVEPINDTFTGWRTRNLHTGFIGKYYYEYGRTTHSFILNPDGSVRKYTDHVNGFATDEFDGSVSMWALNGDVIARTTGFKWDRQWLQYRETQVPEIHEICPHNKYARNMVIGVLTFRQIIEKFYPRYADNFSGKAASWDKKMEFYKGRFAEVSQADIPDVPNVA